MARDKFTRRIAYNRQVLAELQRTNPIAADKLNSQGAALGWWADVEYLFSVGRSAGETAGILAKRYEASKTANDVSIEHFGYRYDREGKS